MLKVDVRVCCVQGRGRLGCGDSVCEETQASRHRLLWLYVDFILIVCVLCVSE